MDGLDNKAHLLFSKVIHLIALNKVAFTTTYYVTARSAYSWCSKCDFRDIDRLDPDKQAPWWFLEVVH